MLIKLAELTALNPRPGLFAQKNRMSHVLVRYSMLKVKLRQSRKNCQQHPSLPNSVQGVSTLDTNWQQPCCRMVSGDCAAPLLLQLLQSLNSCGINRYCINSQSEISKYLQGYQRSPTSSSEFSCSFRAWTSEKMQQDLAKNQTRTCAQAAGMICNKKTELLGCKAGQTELIYFHINWAGISRLLCVIICVWWCWHMMTMSSDLSSGIIWASLPTGLGAPAPW